MAIEIVNTNETLTHDVDSAILNIVTPPDQKVKTNNELFNVRKGPITVAVSEAVSGSCVSAAGAVVINPTAEKAKLQNQLVMREGDKGTGNVTGVISGTSTPCSFDIEVTLQDAGQEKAKAN